jgi:cytochrome c oxidase subunit 3
MEEVTLAEAHAHGAHDDHGLLAHQFEDLEQQKQASTLGMWTFLVNEVMFFGIIFAAYITYRYLYPEAWAEGTHHLNVWAGTINTAVLLTSSLTMALAVHAAQTGDRRATVRYMLITLAFAFVFLGIKAFEYYEEYERGQIPVLNWHPHEPPENPALLPQLQLYFLFYFVMTGLHALHIIGGIGLIGVVAYFAWKGKYSPRKYTAVELTGLYWHFVDLVWVFLFPLLYLTAPSL